VLRIEELRDARAAAVGRTARLVRVPRIGFMRDFAQGAHLAPDRSDGRIRWTEWLERRRATKRL
jgi:hypothetical protein